MRAGVEGLRDILQAQPLTQSDTGDELFRLHGQLIMPFIGLRTALPPLLSTCV